MTTDSHRHTRRRPGVAVTLLVTVAVTLLVRMHVGQLFVVMSESMEPTLVAGDRLLVEKLSVRAGPPTPGDVVVFPDPGSGLTLVKRVVASAGSQVWLVDGVLWVDGVAVVEPYVRADRSVYGPVTVPDGTVMVLGDNRSMSADSRGPLGFVDVGTVEGTVVAVVWPLPRAGVPAGS